MKYKITNFGQSRTIMVQGTGYYLTGRGTSLETNNPKFAEAAATYPQVKVESEKVEVKPPKKKPVESNKSEKTKIDVPNPVNMNMKMSELRKIAKELGIPYNRKDTKVGLIEKIKEIRSKK